MLPAILLSTLLAAPLLPAPASAAKTGGVEGRVTRDGAPVVGVIVKLIRLEQGRAVARLEAKTDGQGRYAFKDVEGGEFSLLLRATVEGILECATSSPAFQIALHKGRNPQGREATLATATTREALRIDSAVTVTRDLALSCAAAQGKE
jgi:5-hydroxyisourate hydrolase-like protein (transthyretin family)